MALQGIGNLGPHILIVKRLRQFEETLLVNCGNKQVCLDGRSTFNVYSNAWPKGFGISLNISRTTLPFLKTSMYTILNFFWAVGELSWLFGRLPSTADADFEFQFSLLPVYLPCTRLENPLNISHDRKTNTVRCPRLIFNSSQFAARLGLCSLRSAHYMLLLMNAKHLSSKILFIYHYMTCV